VLGTSLSGCEDLSKTIFYDSETTTDEGNCGPEIVASMANNPQNKDIDESFVKTYTVGFNVDGGGKRYLEHLAKKGQGRFIEADSEDSLRKALADLILQINGDGQSFSELTVDVNRATFSHDNRVYMNLFSPSNNDSFIEGRWQQSRRRWCQLAPHR